MSKLLLVDGSNLLFQMFYGMPARIVNSEGRAIQGTLGFVGALLKIIRMVKPTHMAVLFDGEYTTVRRTLDEDYKANRVDYTDAAEEETPFSQLPDICRALDLLKIRYAETTICEADDWLAGYAVSYGSGMDVVIVSQDSDLFQLITDRIHILRYRGKHSQFWDAARLWEKYGIRPDQYASFKALTGDPSDNIRGVEKVGPKTAAGLLAQFDDLDTLLSHTEQIRKPSIRASVQASRERIRKNYGLIYLDGGQELPFCMEEMSFMPSEITTTEVLKRIGLK